MLEIRQSAGRRPGIPRVNGDTRPPEAGALPRSDELSDNRLRMGGRSWTCSDVETTSTSMSAQMAALTTYARNDQVERGQTAGGPMTPAPPSGSGGSSGGVRAPSLTVTRDRCTLLNCWNVRSER